MSGFPVYTPGTWKSTATGYYSISVDSTLFAYEGASQAYSLSAPDANTVRFELHDGDKASWDVGAGHDVERDEIASRSDVASNGTALEISYGFTLEKGAPNTAKWMVLGQLHQNLEDTTATGGPVFGVYLNGENMSVIARYTDASGKLVELNLWTDPLPIERGHQYQMDIKVVTDPTGQNGRLVVTRDGVTVADYAGALGDMNMTGVYWAEGIYRDAGASETVAADYSNLQITTGSSVVFPAASAFVAAPQLKVGAVSTAAVATAAFAVSASSTSSAQSTYGINLAGTTKPNGTVAVYENGKLVGSGTADGSGQVSLSVSASGLGTHQYYAIATDASGHQSPTANPVDVVIGTGKTIAGQLDALAADKNLGAVYVTDATSLNVGTGTDLSRILHYTDLLSKLQGVNALVATNAISGKSYDQETLTYTLAGTLTERQRFSNGSLVFDQVINADKSGTAKTINSLGGFDVQTTASDGFLTSFSRYGANGKPSQLQTFGRDGSSTTANYDLTTGLETSFTQKAADKSSISITLGITGQAYTMQTFTYSAPGTLSLQERFTSSGTKIYSASWNADGSRVTHTYDAKTGRETSFSINNADGTSVQGQYGITGKSYTALTTYYGKSGKVTGQTTSNAVGQIPPGSSFVDQFVTSGFTQVNDDGSKLVGAYQSGSTSLLASTKTYDAKGNLIETDLYNAKGQKVSSDVVTASSARVLTSFDATTGLATGFTCTESNGSKSVTTYQAGTTKAAAVLAYDANGHELSSDVYAADGSHVLTSFDVASGAASSVKTIRDDGSYVLNTYTAAGTISHSTTFDTKGVLVAEEDWGADGSHKVYGFNAATGLENGYTSTAADGSRTIAAFAPGQKTSLVQTTTYDATGRVTEVDGFDSAGRKVSTILRFADGSRISSTLDAPTGAVLQSSAVYADKSRIDINNAVVGKPYTQQTVTYDASGKVVSMVRAYGDSAHTVAMTHTVLPDGSSEFHSYDTSGRETSRTLTASDGSSDIVNSTYAGTGTIPTSQQHFQYGTNQQLLSVDTAKADGSHTQVASASGAVLTSTGSVSDTFTGAKSGGDLFVFKPAFGQDIVTNFHAGSGSDHDVVDLSALNLSGSGDKSSFDVLAQSLKQTGRDAILTISPTDSILFKNTNVASLTKANFHV